MLLIRRSVAAATANRRDRIKNAMSDRDLWLWGIQGAAGAGKKRWTKEAVLGGQKYIDQLQGSSAERERTAELEVVRARDEYAKSMRDWYFATKHKARVEEKARKRRELYHNGRAKAGKGTTGTKEVGKKNKAPKVATLSIRLRSEQHVGEKMLHFPIDLCLPVPGVLNALVERGELPDGADHETHAVLLEVRGWVSTRRVRVRVVPFL